MGKLILLTPIIALVAGLIIAEVQYLIDMHNMRDCGYPDYYINREMNRLPYYGKSILAVTIVLILLITLFMLVA